MVVAAVGLVVARVAIYAFIVAADVVVVVVVCI